MASTALQLFIADGFADDCDELIHRCLRETPVTYRVFCEVFRNMQMSCVFHDRNSGAEIAELSEEVINIAKYYMLANTSNFEETVIGLFLVYAMVTLQPFANFAYLRIVDEDVPLIVRIEQVARRDKRLDVLYVLGRVLVEHSRYHAAARERGMEAPYKKYLEGGPMGDSLGLRPKGVFLRQNEELDIIKELSGLQLRYDAAKSVMKAFDLNYTDPKLPEQMESSLRNIITGIIQPSDKDPNIEVQESARTIKERAMKSKVDGIKYLIGVNERSPTKSKAPHKSDIKSSPGKVKTGCAKKLPNIQSRRKQSLASLKRKRITSNESAEESDKSIELSDPDSEADIDLDMFDKVEHASKDIKDDEIEIDGRNLQFDELPCVFSSTSNGQTYEIEIIDKLKPAKQQNNSSPAKKMNTNTAGVPKRRLKPKPELKKTIVKSRFKRLGIGNAANFET